jgi:hypothetical protein
MMASLARRQRDSAIRYRRLLIVNILDRLIRQTVHDPLPELDELAIIPDG